MANGDIAMFYLYHSPGGSGSTKLGAFATHLGKGGRMGLAMVPFDRATVVSYIGLCSLLCAIVHCTYSVVAYGNDRYLLAQSTKFGICIA